MPILTATLDGSSVTLPITISQPQPAAARFTLFNYGATATVADAARYAVMDLGYGLTTTAQSAAKLLVRNIRQAQPTIECLLYQAPVSVANDPGGAGSMVTWTGTYPGSIPSSWFLVNASGGKIVNPAATGQAPEYVLDPGNPVVQQACAQHAVNVATAAGYTGIFLDVIAAAGLHWLTGGKGVTSNPACQSISSDTAWQTAVAAFLTVLATTAHSRGLRVYANIGGAYGTATWTQAWQRYLSTGIDGAMEESFGYGTDGKPVPVAQWQQQLANVAWAEQNGKTTLCNADVFGSPVENTFGLASMLLASNGLACWNAASGSEGTGGWWFPEYDAALALGTPLGPSSVSVGVSGGVWSRQFTGGTITVNPSTQTVTGL